MYIPNLLCQVEWITQISQINQVTHLHLMKMFMKFPKEKIKMLIGRVSINKRKKLCEKVEKLIYLKTEDGTTRGPTAH